MCCFYFDRTSDEAKTNGQKLQNQLDNASPSYGGVLLKFSKKGTYNFMCTRNNNFTNRSQKGAIVVN